MVIDVVPGRGAGFSLEAGEGVRFLSRARIVSGLENTTCGASEPDQTRAQHLNG
jgi:hypothetical protein